MSIYKSKIMHRISTKKEEERVRVKFAIRLKRGTKNTSLFACSDPIQRQTGDLGNLSKHSVWLIAQSNIGCGETIDLIKLV